MNTRPVSIGGVLLNPAGNVVSYFGSYISGSLLNVFLEEQRHSIFELETFSSGRCAQSVVEIYHVKTGILLFGQDAARSTFIRASASTSLSTTLVADYVDLNTNAFSLSVYRVASRSNPADQPFRLDFLRSVYVMQKGLNLSCQRTCRSGESTGALTLEKHDSLSRSSNMDRQHEPIRHHSFEAGIKASISKLPRQCKSGR